MQTRGRNLATRLTPKMVEEAKSKPGERVELSDTNAKGLRLRVSGSGSTAVKTWAFVGRRDGGKGAVERVTLGRYPAMSLDDARAKAREYKGEQEAGTAPTEKAQAERAAVTFDDLADAYIARAKRTKASWAQDEAHLKRARKEFGSRDVSKLTRVDFATLLEGIAAKAPVSANRAQTALRTMLGYGVEIGMLSENVLAGVRKFGGRETDKDRVLSDNEIKALWGALDDDESRMARTIQLALRMILLTCARPGEVAGMRVDELNLEGPTPTWTIPGKRTKNRERHVIPLSDVAVTTLHEALLHPHRTVDGESPYVFASKWGSQEAIARHSLSQATKRMCGGVNFERFTPHDLRRTGATVARSAGATRDAVKALLNHKDGSVTAIYDRHDMLDEKRDAVAKLARKIIAVVGDSDIAALA